jgi:hypothetical protein
MDPARFANKVVHLFDAKAGGGEPISLSERGITQVIFSSTNVSSYKQTIRLGDAFMVLLPSLTESEFERYVKFFDVSPARVQEILKIIGFGKIRPLVSYESFLDRVTSGIINFDFSKLSDYASTENESSTANGSPAVLLNAYTKFDVPESEIDLKKLVEAYKFSNGVWDISSMHILEQLRKKYGTQANLVMEQLFYSLTTSQQNLTFGPFAGRLFESIAPQLIVESGLLVENLKNDSFVLKVSSVASCPPNTSAADIFAKYNDTDKLYTFVKSKNKSEQCLFDAFIPPNNLISFTHTMPQRDAKQKPGNFNKPILLNVALDWAKLFAESNKKEVNFITAVPEHLKAQWNKTQSYSVNIQDDEDRIQKNENKNGSKEFQVGGQRQLQNLSTDTQNKLKYFKQFVGSVKIRKFSTAVVRTVANTTFLRRLFKG